MLALRDLLRQFDWREYEAKAYCALVQHGPLKANDVALNAGIPPARIYGILESLYSKGRIRKVQESPVAYDAENPRYLIDSHRELLEKQANEALANAEQIWDVRAESSGSTAKRAYTVMSIQGIVTTVRSLIENAKESILIVDSNLEWMRRKDIDSLLRFTKEPRKLEVVSSNDSSNILPNLKRAGIAYKTSKSICVNFYVADEERVVIRLSGPDTGVFVHDKGLARQLSSTISQLGA